MVRGNSNSNDDDDGQWTMDMVIFLLSTWRSILNNSSDNNISFINAKRLDLFILIEDCNGALSLVVIFVGVIVGWSLMAEQLLQIMLWRESIVLMIDPAPCVRNKEENMMNDRAGRYMANIRAELKSISHNTQVRGWIKQMRWATDLVSEHCFWVPDKALSQWYPFSFRILSPKIASSISPNFILKLTGRRTIKSGWSYLVG